MSDFRLPPFSVELQMMALSETIDWSKLLYGIPGIWTRTRGRGQVVAVLDTGIDRRHLEVGDFREAILNAADFTGSVAGFYDMNGHGTHTAGTIGARQDDNGVIGVMPECKLLIGKVLGDSGGGNGETVGAGMRWARTSGATVISMSLGSSNPDPKIYQELQAAVDQGICVVCAAGNSGPSNNTVDYPGRWQQSVSVGAVDEEGNVASFSSRGPEVDICAPGVGILSTYRNGGYAKLSGTSMATPFVAGVVGLLLSTGVKLTPGSIKTMLRSTARHWKPGQGEGSGVGLIDPTTLLAPPPPPVVCPVPSPDAVDVGPFKVSVETIGDRKGLFISIS